MDQPQFPPIFEIDSDEIIVWDHKLSGILYSLGFFGKPLGLRKTMPGNFSRPLVLSLFDSCYLVENGIIRISLEEKILTFDQLMNYANIKYDNFERKYMVYRSFRNKGYIVRPGMKFGSDFVIYDIGPGYDHSKWVIHVEKDDIKLKAINIVRAGRLAASVKKRYLVTTINNDNEIISYSFDRSKI